MVVCSLRLVSTKVSVQSLSVDATLTSYGRRAEGLLQVFDGSHEKCAQIYETYIYV